MTAVCRVCAAPVPYSGQLAGIRYCHTCQLRAKATWQLRTAVLYAERAGLPEATALRRIAEQIAPRGSFTRAEVLRGGFKRGENFVDSFVDAKPSKKRVA